MTPALPTRITSTHLVLLGAIVFLANAGLLVLQLLAGRYLAPFIGSSVETWTAVIGVFLTGIAFGNHYGGKIADRAPTTKTLGILLLLGAASALTMMLGWMICTETGIDQSIPLGPRIPILAALFCFLPGFVLSLLTPLTIKLMLADVTKAGRISGIVFAVSTLGCLLGNYATGFWLMANYTLNAITIGVVIGLAVLAVPMFLVPLRANTLPTTTKKQDATLTDDPLGFRKDIRRAFAVVFMASFCGMSLELAASRVIAPMLGVSLYTWTGIIGVMLAGTACGNYLGGVIADRGSRIGLQRLVILLATLLGFAAAPALIRTITMTDYPVADSPTTWFCRLFGAGLGFFVAVLITTIRDERKSFLIGLLILGGGLGYAAAHPVFRSLANFIGSESLSQWLADARYHAVYARLLHLVGAIIGAGIAFGLGYDPKKEVNQPSPTKTLTYCLFGAAGFTGLVVMFSGMIQRTELGIYYHLTGPDLVSNVITYTFLLFFLPMLCLGMISPQVIRLSLSDTSKAGRTAGSIYAWSTAGAIVGTFATGFFLIGLLGINRVLFGLALILLGLAFMIDRLKKSSSALFVGGILLGAAVVGFIVIGRTRQPKEMLYYDETKYYTIKVKFEDEAKTRKQMVLDLLIHSWSNPADPMWLGYQHEEVQGELVRHARSKGPTDILVIGGGAYTFPRWVEKMFPDVGVDVVEIDPGVTKAAIAEFNLSPDSKTVRPIHMDGRQYVREKAPKGHYKLVIQDAVNDLSVPYHLMTKEYNETVKTTLAPDGAYLLTIIDSMEKGKLWRSAIYTMRQTFKHVEILDPSGFRNPDGSPNTSGRHVYVIYGSDTPLDLKSVETEVLKFTNDKANYLDALAGNDSLYSAYIRSAAKLARARYFSYKMDQEELETYLQREPPLILTDQYAPVDNLMGKVFLER